jgi:hypothetical protein
MALTPRDLGRAARGAIRRCQGQKRAEPLTGSALRALLGLLIQPMRSRREEGIDHEKAVQGTRP